MQETEVGVFCKLLIDTKMKREEYIEEKVGRDVPFKVPNGYFNAFVAEMEAKLPPFPAAPKPEKLSAWQKIRPYVYLAAMFCGIWCMMKIFHTATSINSPLEAPAEHIAMVMENPTEYDVAVSNSSQDDFSLEMDVLDSYDSLEELQNDLRAEL